jgi:hypothetical protein
MLPFAEHQATAAVDRKLRAFGRFADIFLSGEALRFAGRGNIVDRYNLAIQVVCKGWCSHTEECRDRHGAQRDNKSFRVHDIGLAEEPGIIR